MNKICEVENKEKNIMPDGEPTKSEFSPYARIAVGAGLILDIGIVIYAIISNLAK